VSPPGEFFFNAALPTCVRLHVCKAVHYSFVAEAVMGTIGLNHEIAILAEVVMKTRQYLQINCNGVLQCNDVSK